MIIIIADEYYTFDLIKGLMKLNTMLFYKDTDWEVTLFLEGYIIKCNHSFTAYRFDGSIYYDSINKCPIHSKIPENLQIAVKMLTS